MDEEVSVIVPLKWNLGKILYVIIRYGTLGYIALQLSRDYRTYLAITLAVGRTNGSSSLRHSRI
ncbi:hypothetical protein FA13DRAFT_1735494 [Coprinellus micaceus]|uniref:Uncharacterized protein n=1 Tax=Coprinellus micaceus TaxID=71717 RepID=A0A4Y7T402_COPMI|nr:hypothetical protein FA13DRAFT_1735494 [Coprinellus micaceus]